MIVHYVMSDMGVNSSVCMSLRTVIRPRRTPLAGRQSPQTGDELQQQPSITNGRWLCFSATPQKNWNNVINIYNWKLNFSIAATSALLLAFAASDGLQFASTAKGTLFRDWPIHLPLPADGRGGYCELFNCWYWQKYDVNSDCPTHCGAPIITLCVIVARVIIPTLHYSSIIIIIAKCE